MSNDDQPKVTYGDDAVQVKGIYLNFSQIFAIKLHEGR
jgi:hypothetical protein